MTGLLPPRTIRAVVEDLALLSPAARAIWAVLARRRVRAGAAETEWFIADARLLARYAGLAYSTALRALADLRHAGLVATSRCQVNRWYRNERGVIESCMANEHNLYLVPGSYTKRSGVETFMFPQRAWLEYVEKARPQCRAFPIRAKIRVKAWRKPIEVVEWQPDWNRDEGFTPSASYLRGFRKNPAGFKRLLSTSVYTSNNSPTESHSSTKNEKAKRTFFSKGLQPQNDQGLNTYRFDLSQVKGSDDELVRNLLSAPRRPLVPLPGKPTLVALDPIPPAPQTITWISPEASPELKARAVLEGYRRAVNKVYGVRWFGWVKGDIKKARAYKGFVKCGEAMADHSVPPDHWALWRLEWLKQHTPRFAKQPPPIHVVMSAKRVSERAGWFRKEYVLPMPIHELDPIRHEQMLRNRESSRRHEGFTEAGVWMVMPPWYYEKRQQEIAEGLTDPHDCWPKRPKYAHEQITWWRAKSDA
jgi:hypothetical protein